MKTKQQRKDEAWEKYYAIRYQARDKYKAICDQEREKYRAKIKQIDNE